MTHAGLDAIEASLVGEPSGAEIEAAVTALRALAERAFAGDVKARSLLQPLLYRLHYGKGEDTRSFRQWLASRVYTIEERSVPPWEWPQGVQAPLSPEQLLTVLQAEQKRLSPLGHPLFRYLFGGRATMADCQTYLLHKWLIMLTFWRALAELGYRLQREELDGSAVLYENVYEELGEGDTQKAHLRQHYRQLRHIGVPVTWEQTPRYPETYEYINFRLHCMRHEQPGWGLGSAFSQEATSLAYTMGHYDLLRSLGVESQYCEVYYVHEEIDTEHTDELAALIGRMAATEKSQSACLRAQRHQMTLWHRHFDRVMEEMSSA